MKRRYLMLSPLLLILFCSPALAHEHETTQVLVTVNPNLFAPGQNISNATTGAQLLAMTFVPNPDPNFPDLFCLSTCPRYMRNQSLRAATGF